MFAKTNQTLKIILADDQILVRDLLRAMLEREGFQVSCVAPDGAEAVCLCRELKPDVAVLDISMPRLDGISATRAIKAVSPRTKIILLSMHPQEAYVREGLRAGASAYVLKMEAFPALLGALFAVMHGGTYLSPGVSQITGAYPVSPAFVTAR